MTAFAKPFQIEFLEAPAYEKTFVYKLEWKETERFFEPVQKELWVENDFALHSAYLKGAWEAKAPKALNAYDLKIFRQLNKEYL